MCRASLRETLWATLKANNVERVVFYNAVDKFFFLDEESNTLAQTLSNKSAPRESPSAARPRSAMQRGPLGDRNVLTGQTRMVAPANRQSDTTATVTASATSSNGDEKAPPDTTTLQNSPPYPLPRMIRMTPARGATRGMSDAAMLTTLNDFMQDRSVRTAVVIEDLENLSSRFDHGINDQLAARLREWDTLRGENQNCLIFISSREVLDSQSNAAMRNIASSFSEISNLI